MASNSPRTANSHSNWLNTATAKLCRTIYRQANHKYNFILKKLKLEHEHEVELYYQKTLLMDATIHEQEQKIKTLEEEVSLLKLVDREMSKEIIPTTLEKPKDNRPTPLEISDAYKIINRSPDEVDITYLDDVLIIHSEKQVHPVPSERPKKKRKKNKNKYIRNIDSVEEKEMTKKEDSPSVLKEAPQDESSLLLTPPSPKKRLRSSSPPSSGSSGTSQSPPTFSVAYIPYQVSESKSFKKKKKKKKKE